MENSKEFSGYFISKAERPTKVFGVYWENAWPCGTYVNSKGVLKAVVFVKMFDDVEDTMTPSHTGRNCQQLDMNLSEMDALLTDPIIGDLIKAVPVSLAKKASLKEEQAEVFADNFEQTFCTKRIMVDRKMMKLDPSYLGRTFAKALANKPSIWQPTIDPESGLEVPNVWKCNLGPTVES